MTLHDALLSATSSVFRFETQFVYKAAGEVESLKRYAETGEIQDGTGSAAWRELVGDLRGRGATVRRVRALCDPLTEYLRWEMALALVSNIPAGEDVRVLAADAECRPTLPPHDFWVFDDETVWIMRYTDGVLIESVPSTDPDVLANHLAWRDTAWRQSHEWHEVDAANR